MSDRPPLTAHRHADLTKHVDERAIASAIADAEKRTSGTIHVSIAKHVRGATRAEAVRVFHSLGYATPESKAVMFFVVPSRRELTVLGGAAVHAALGEAYWQKLVDAVIAEVRTRDLTSGLAAGIADVGRKLAELFPAEG